MVWAKQSQDNLWFGSDFNELCEVFTKVLTENSLKWFFTAYVYQTQSHFSSPFTFSHSFLASRPSFVSHPCTCSLYATSPFLVPRIVIFVKPPPGAGSVRQSWHVRTYSCPGAKCCLADEKMCNVWAHLLITRCFSVFSSYSSRASFCLCCSLA